MFDPKRQHPLMILISFLDQLKAFIVPVILVGGLEILFGERSGFNIGYILVPVVIFALSMVGAFLHWWFYRYDYKDDSLYVKKGVFIKQERTIKRERIQTIHIEAGIIQRIFGLVKVSVETAGGLAKSELEIKALEKDKAYTLKETLEKGNIESSSDYQSEEDESGYEVNLVRLLAAGLTSGSVFVIMGVTFAFALQFTFLLPDDVWSDLNAMGAAVIGLIIALYVVASWVISVIRYAITYAFYTVRKVNGEFSIKRGLIRQKHLSLKEHRVQSVSFIEGVLRQPFAFGTLQVDVAGGSGYKEQTKTVTHPLIREDELDEYFNYAFKDHEYTNSVDPLPRRALRRYLIRSALPFLIPGIILVFFTLHALWLLIPMGLNMLWAVQRFKDAGMRLDERQINLRFRMVAKTTVFTRKNHIQALKISRNILQRWRGLASIQIKILSSPSAATYQVKDVAYEDAVRVYSWLKQ